MNNCNNNDEKILQMIEQNKRCCRPCFGPTGPTGPTGPSGGPAGVITVGNTITGEPGTQAAVIESLVDNNNVLNFVIPQGPTGPTGPQKVRSAFLLKFDDNYAQDGIEVLSNGRLPIDRIGIKTSDICVLDPNDNTIQFNKVGNYRIDFTVNASIQYPNTNFDLNTDFISIGFRRVDDGVIYAGASEWINDEASHQIVANGLFVVDNVATPYELVNFSNRTIYLNSPGIENLGLPSYFLNPVVTILIQYLG
ncbi:MAG: hypothetical protein J6J17_05550 [Bacilli bacterium]|nr:hypothetical protein [Bacilli bacterium]